MVPWSGFWQGAIEFEYAFRIALSCFCGLLIGLERTRQQKEAGIRTHILVAMGAALIMMVSKYGFFDIVALNLSTLDVDAARMGSTILTGISFLGAGVILQRSGAVRGLTTAAGVWVTGGVGVAIGAGMYALGIACTVLTVFIQIVLKRVFARIDDPADNGITVHIPDGPGAVEAFTASLEARGMPVRVSHMSHKDGMLILTLLFNDQLYERAARQLAEHPDVMFVDKG